MSGCAMFRQVWSRGRSINKTKCRLGCPGQNVWMTWSIIPSSDEEKRYFSSKKGGGGKEDLGRGRDVRRIKHKNNFDRKVLQPAARGELSKKHDSGIPKLAGRKPHAHLEPQSSRPRVFVRDEEDDLGWEEELSESDSRTRMFEALSRGRMSKDVGSVGMPPPTADGVFSSEDLSQMDYYAPQLIDDEKYFWREEEFEEQKLEHEVDFDEEEGFVVEYGKKDFERQAFDPLEKITIEDEGEEDDGVEGMMMGRQPSRGEQRESWEMLDPEDQFFYNQNDLFEIATLDSSLFKDEGMDEDENYNQVLPLKGSGPNLDDFLQAMQEHPTKYAQIDYEKLHPESRREPLPDFPKNRANPPLEFVESHARFLYVTGLPPLELDGERGDLSNPVHRSLLEKTIARLAGVDTTRVFAANTTSGFVGFDSPRDLAAVLANGPSERSIPGSAVFSDYTGIEGGEDFYKVSPETTLVLKDITPGNTPVSLARDLFPEGTEVGAVYGNLKPVDFFFLSSTSALVRFESEEQAQSVLESHLVRERLEQFCQYPVRFFRARRELLHDGYGGAANTQEKRKMGPRLIVDGDMPSKKFYLSHACVLKIRNLDTSLTKEDISALFQPFSTLRRDIHGSIEFVTCEAGIPTGHAYIGFDIPEDGEAAIKKMSGIMKIGDRHAILKMVKDRRIPRQPLARPQRRPDRSADELLEDLTGWEQYVDPADIELLEKGGISRIVLDEALRAIRYKNPSYGALDYSLRSEALEPEKDTGAMYKEMVQLYVETLKECLATPDNVGDLYEAVHFPGEPIDTSIFEQEKERQKILLKEKARP